jgi:hypothetical protein
VKSISQRTQRALDLFQRTQLPTNVIAERVGMTTQRVWLALKQAKQRGDPRAANFHVGGQASCNSCPPS